MVFVNVVYRCFVCNVSFYFIYKIEKKIFFFFYFICKLVKMNNCDYGVYNLYIYVYIK